MMRRSLWTFLLAAWPLQPAPAEVLQAADAFAKSYNAWVKIEQLELNHPGTVDARAVDLWERVEHSFRQLRNVIRSGRA